MARGFNRRQIGVTEQMFDTFGEIIFNMSHNHQVREGDPYRLKDWDEVERHRELMGLSDGQIAEKIGLTRNQVMYIRTLMERRRFRTGHYARLLELGGGKRFRAERFTPHLDHFKYSDDALELRAAMNFPPDLARRYVADGWWRNDTLPRWIERHVEERPDAPAIRMGDMVLSYADLAEQVDRLARGLWDLGLRPGDVIAIQLPNLPAYIISYLAIAQIGAVMSTIHMPYRETEIESFINHGRARAMICLASAKDWSPAETVLGLRAKLPTLKHVIAVGDATPDGAIGWQGLIDADTKAEITAEPAASDPFLLLFTSGTTSAPKAVPLNPHNMLTNGRDGAVEHELDETSAVLCAAPFSHLFGLYAIHCALAVGGCNVLLPAFTPPDMATAIERDQPTALWTAPAHMAALRGLELFDKHDLSSLKMMIMSGTACPEQLVRFVGSKLPNCAVPSCGA